MLIRQLFKKDVTRKIPPVVYFGEQEAAKLSEEVGEYIITGGYPSSDPRSTDGGIHEQFVRLLTALRRELERTGGPELPASWVSGFYGSGKSSFAKLLGLALDGRSLPDGTSLASALLAQDHSPRRGEFKQAWDTLLEGLQPVAVVFDIGSKARDGEHVHSVVVRQVMSRFGYSSTSSAVAEYELNLQLEGRFDEFIKLAAQHFGKPWSELKDTPLAEDRFSEVMHRLNPRQFSSPMAWVDSRAGSAYGSKRSADEAVVAIRNVMDQRCPGRTLFVVVDEVSQYVHDNQDRMLALQSFVSALGQRLRGKAWLLATGQQKLEESAGNVTSLSKLKDRFPPSLRIHLGEANIRDVLHRRLLRKDPAVEPQLRRLFEQHRDELALYAYRGDEVSDTEFVEFYPLLPGHVDLLLKITSGLRLRSTRAQGDSHAIRGLLQLLGDLFREQRFDEQPVGQLVTLDRVYDILHTALNVDVQRTLGRAFEFCSRQREPLMPRVVKAVALLELLQDEEQKTSAELVARCLYTHLGDPSMQDAVQRALDALVGESLLSVSEKSGYKIQSTAGQEWQSERDDYVPSPERMHERIREALRWLVDDVDKPKQEALEIPWRALFSDGVTQKDAVVKDERKHTVVCVDFQFTAGEGADQWVPRSHTPVYSERVVWVAGDRDGARDEARQLIRSERMVEMYEARQSSLLDEKVRLLMEERNLLDAGRKKLSNAVKAAFMAGDLYFRGLQVAPRDVGATFEAALHGFGQRILSKLYPHIVTFTVSEKDILYLIDNKDLTAPPAVFGEERLGLIKLDANRHIISPEGQIPRDVFAFVQQNAGITGSSVLAHFGAPPHGVPPDVIKATVVGLLRANRIRIRLPGVGDLTSHIDQGVRELIKDTGLRRAELLPNNDPPVSQRDRVEICKLFKDCFGVELARSNDAIADEVTRRFGGIRERLTEVGLRFRQLPTGTEYPAALAALENALEGCRRSRQVEPTVVAVKRCLPALRDGLSLLRRMETDLTEDVVRELRQASDLLRYQWPQLATLDLSREVHEHADAIAEHLARDRPWEDSSELAPRVSAVRDAYREQRRTFLRGHQVRIDAVLERLKRQPGYELLTSDECHQVLSPVRDGAAVDTDDNAIAPELPILDDLFGGRLDAAEHRALARLDDLLEGRGRKPTVELLVCAAGRLIDDAKELDRWLDELRQRVLRELDAKHRVRLR